MVLASRRPLVAMCVVFLSFLRCWCYVQWFFDWCRRQAILSCYVHGFFYWFRRQATITSRMFIWRHGMYVLAASQLGGCMVVELQFQNMLVHVGGEAAAVDGTRNLSATSIVCTKESVANSFTLTLKHRLPNWQWKFDSSMDCKIWSANVKLDKNEKNDQFNT